MTVELQIDGSMGEGGGQVLRSSLALSLLTGRPFRMDRIRAGRDKPGLLRQHLTAVRAAAEIGQAEVEGAELRSQAIRFRPGVVLPGEYRFAVGTAGSTSLVLQTVLPALLTAPAPSVLILEGGTHNPMAPPFDFLARAFLPVLARMGPRVDVELDRYGFYPAGGGKVAIHIDPVPRLERLELCERGEIVRGGARAVVVNLPESIADRELERIGRRLGWTQERLRKEVVSDGLGPGNFVVVEIEGGQITELFTGIGSTERSAEAVAEGVCQEVREYLAAEVPVGRHLADQLLLPMAMAGAGVFRTLALTRHCTTNMEVIKKFIDVDIVARPVAQRVVEVEVR